MSTNGETTKAKGTLNSKEKSSLKGQNKQKQQQANKTIPSGHALDSQLHAVNGKSQQITTAAPFNIVCQFKAKLHEDTFVFCQDCHIYFCIKCDAVYHNNQSDLLGHVRSSVVAESNSFNEEFLPPVNTTMMPSFDSITINDNSFESSPSIASPTSKCRNNEQFNDGKGLLLINEKEILQVHSAGEFVKRLVGCSDKTFVKVVSIFGNTGEGKSHTLNHVFFGGEEVFRTSPSQTSCTLGVWAAYNPGLRVIVLDTEGMLGTSSNHNQRTRLLLKVMAISDVVIYRTRAERLHSDMYQFLGDASKAFNSHFKKELQAASERCKIEGPLSQLGPYVIIFHETQHTDILKPDKNQDVADILRKAFHDQRHSYDAFSGLKYVGTRTQTKTDYKCLTEVVKKQIKISDVRSFRLPSVIFQVLQMLNNKFSGHIENTIAEAFPDQYFTCSVRCRSCGSRCCNSTNHNELPHECKTKCKFQHQFQNRIYLCKGCHDRGETSVVVSKAISSGDSSWVGLAKYAWSGYVIECNNCGVIYQSRKYWYGNREPYDSIQAEIQHVWPGTSPSNNGSLNMGQKVLDGITFISNTVASVGAVPSKTVSDWVADYIAPQYWAPNNMIKKCHLCGHHFDATDKKHHCRACGQGFCGECSNYFRPVPDRGWGEKPVRVCKSCFNIQSAPVSNSNEEVTARKVGEMLQSTLGTVVSAMEYPKGIIKDSARPSYWVPDEHIVECNVCHKEFTPKLTRHHCRACGQGVCQNCSPEERPVPARGWPQPVRVCKACIESGDLDC